MKTTPALPLALSALLALLATPRATAETRVLEYSDGADQTNNVPDFTFFDFTPPSGILLAIGSGTAIERGNLIAGSLINKEGDGTLVYTGTAGCGYIFHVVAGTLQIGNGGTSGTITPIQFEVDSGATLAFNRSDDITYAVPFISGGSVAQNGTGTLTLTSPNYYSGGTTLNAGTLALGDAGALSDSGTITFNGGALRWTAANTTDHSSRFSTAAGQQYRFDTGGQSVTLGATALTSSGGTLTKVGAGTLTLTAANTYDGGTSLNAGTLVVAHDSALGTGTLTLNGGTLATNTARTLTNALALTADSTLGGSQALTLAGAVTLTGTSALAVDAGATPTISGIIGGAGTLTKTGAGTLALTGANNYSGGTVLSAGGLALGSNTALGSGTVSLNGGTLAASGAARTLANAVTLDSDSTLGGSQALTFTGGFTLAKNRDLTVTNTALTTISGTISESGGGRSLAKYGTGTLELTGANTYTGGTYIGAGTVRINNATGSAFGTGAVTVASGATLTGAGSFSGAFQNNGIFAPGNSPDLQTLASFSQGSGGTLVLELGGLARGTGYDALDITGSASLGGTLEVTFYGAFTAASLAGGESFDLFNWGSVSGTFADVNLPTLDGGLTWNTSALYSSGVLSVSGAAIPEPSTYAALLGGAACLAVAIRRKRGVLGLVAWRRRTGR